MKKLRKALLPVAFILIGAGAAFATNAAKNSQSTETGYYIDGLTGECKNSPEQCSVSGTSLCTWNDGSSIHTLYRNGTDCTVQMFKPVN
jgi:hypothetical protein